MSSNPEERRTDEELLAAFEETSLPFAEWTHRSHLRVAYIYLNRSSFDEAVDRIRSAIRQYNLAHDVPSTPTRGYHETLTVAFMTLVASAIASDSRRNDSEAFLESNPDLLNKRVLERYYSSELLASASARRSFLSPDRRPLPLVPHDRHPTNERQEGSNPDAACRSRYEQNVPSGLRRLGMPS